MRFPALLSRGVSILVETASPEIFKSPLVRVDFFMCWFVVWRGG